MSNPPWDPKRPIVPVRPDGSIMSYPLHSSEWREFEPFYARLELEGTRRGRSSLIFIWVDEQGRKWPMFATDVADLITRGTIRAGFATGLWTAAKRGANYGLRLA